MTRLATGSASLVGQVRAANEDSFALTDDLVVVADGMGGHLAGEVASADAVEVVGAAAGRRSLAELVSAIHLANRRINDRAAEDDELRGMGTTVCAVGVVDDDGEHLAVLNVGDSRVYLLSQGSLHRLTEDHSLVETLVREGRITAAEAEVHPQRNVLTRALGVEPLVVVDAWLLAPCDGDRLLLCSDGLFNELTEDRIAEILGDGDEPDVAARRLAAEADAAGGRDNITTVVVDVLDSGEPPAPLEGRYRRIATPAVDLDDLYRDPASDTATVPMVSVAPAPNGERGDEPDDLDAVDATDAYEAGLDDTATDDTGEPASGAEPDGIEDADAVGAPAAPAGADDDLSDEDLSDDDAVAAADDEAAAANARPRRSWRTPLFVLAVVAVLASAIGAAVYASSGGWFIGVGPGTDDDDVVALYKGTTTEFLWFGPTLEETTDILVADLRPSDRSRVEQRRWDFPNRDAAERQIDRLQRSTTSTTTTTTTTTSTTVAPTTAPPTTGGSPADPADPSASNPGDAPPPTAVGSGARP